MRKIAICLLLMFAASGCGGYYIMTVPDQLGKKDGKVVPVARLQRNDFFVLALAVPDSPLRFQIEEGPERASYTDEFGYAAVSLAAPSKVGQYNLKVSLQDFEGEEVNQAVPVYIWDAAKPVVAVDFNCLPNEGSIGSDEAAKALRKIAGRANILYLSRSNQPTQNPNHERLKRGGFPDGPILLWQRKRWHIVRDGKFKIPRVVVESRLDSQLPQLCVEFPKLTTGICKSSLAAKAFTDAGMKCVVVGNSWLKGDNLVHRKSWVDLETTGLK